MKRILLLFLLSAVSLSAIEPIGGIKASIYSENSQYIVIRDIQAMQYSLPKNTIKTELKIGANVTDWLTIYTKIDTYMVKADCSIYFNPYQNDYFITAFFDLGEFQLGVEHVCYHPVLVYGVEEVEKYGGYSSAFISWEF